jgi:hypothetical protein
MKKPRFFFVGGGVLLFLLIKNKVNVEGFLSIRERIVPMRSSIVGRGNIYSTTALSVHQVRDADLLEQLVGGVRYSLVPMPDLMKATTAYVGNLCEFVNDDDLSDLFAQVSTLQSIPSCVVRKPDYSSLQYGFVSFPSETEKIVSEVDSGFYFICFGVVHLPNVCCY